MKYGYKFTTLPKGDHRYNIFTTIIEGVATEQAADKMVRHIFNSVLNNDMARNVGLVGDRDAHVFSKNVARFKTALTESTNIKLTPKPQPGMRVRKLERVNIDTGKLVRVVSFKPLNVDIDLPGKYGFLHPTKNGGTAVEDFLFENYRNFFCGSGHETISKDIIHAGKIPVMIVRHPIGRFFSSYYYWRNGATSGPFTRDDDWNPMAKTPGEFIKLRRGKNKQLLNQIDTGFTWSAHFDPQCRWFAKPHWDKSLVLMYSPNNLQENLFALLDYLGLDPPKQTLKVINKTKKDDQNPELTEDEYAWLRQHYKKDFELWNAVTNQKDKFLQVIGTV